MSIENISGVLIIIDINIVCCFPGFKPTGPHELCHQEGGREMYGDDHLG